jgi:hypothetical protein
MTSTRTLVLVLVLAVATLSAACALNACDKHDGTPGAKGALAAPQAGSVSTSKDAGPTQDDSDSSTLTVALDKTATWKNGVTARLSGFSQASTAHRAHVLPGQVAELEGGVRVHQDRQERPDRVDPDRHLRRRLAPHGYLHRHRAVAHTDMTIPEGAGL